MAAIAKALERAVLVMVALGIGAPVPLRANPADILLVNGKIPTRDANFIDQRRTRQRDR
jgi:hypothetical protein